MIGHEDAHSLESLPSSWLAELVAKLPAHLKLQVRQCSKHMQQLVDASGVQLRLAQQPLVAQATGLQLCRQLLASLDFTGLPIGSGTDSTMMFNPFFTALEQTAKFGLPRLKQLACDVAHVQLLVAVAAHSPQLAHLRLHSKADLSAADEACWSTLEQRLPGMAASLTCLEMDDAAHQQFALQSCMWPAVGACIGLQSLLLHTGLLTQSYSLPQWSLTEHAWEAAVQPLTGLTRLEMGTRAPASAASISSIFEYEASHAEDASALPAAAAGGDNSALPLLRHLCCYGLDEDAQDSWGLSWTCTYSSLTSLDLLWVSAGEVDFEALAQLRQLRSLEMHCCPDELFMSSELAPLASCSHLTCLRLDSLVVEPGHKPPGAAAVEQEPLPLGRTGAATASAAGHNEAAALAAGEPGAAAAAAVVLPQLSTLQILVAGVLCQAPIATFAPNLTQLRDLDYDLEQLELDSSFVAEQPPAGREPLAQLTELQLLAVNIPALARHAAHGSLTQLASLRELHIEMVGDLAGTCISSGGGLPMLPYLTRLVLTLAPQVGYDLEKIYSTEEDVLLWQNQAAVQQLRLQGSRLLGGFLAHQHLLELLPQKLQQLHCIQLVKCSDLAQQHLARLVAVRAAPLIVVQHCAGISERDCVALQDVCRGAVTVHYRA